MAEPMGPCPLALDLALIGCAQSRERCNRAVLGGVIIKRDIEAVPIGFDVEKQVDIVFGAKNPFGINQRAARTDIDLGGEIDALHSLARDALGDAEIVDLELVNADVEIGQQRCIGIARKQLRQARQSAAPRCQLAYVDAAPQPA